MDDQQIERFLSRMSERRLDGVGIGDANRTMLIDLAARHIELAKRGRPDEGERYLEIDARNYLDPELFEREKQAIFRRYPMVAGLSRDLPEPGDFLKLDEGDTPILVTRLKSGGLKAFVNACRHRGAALVYEPRGSGRTTFTCPYHAWTYAQDGRLIGVTCAEAFEGLDKSKYGLIEVPVAEAHGIVFVSPSPDVPLDLDAYLGGQLHQELPFWGFDKVTAARSEPIVLDGNWKLVLETFLESYHFGFAHKDNLAHFYNCNVNTVDRFGKNVRMSSSLRTIVAELDGQPQDSWVPENYVHVKYVFFPGMVLINSPQVLEMFRVFPLAVDKTVVQHSCYSRLPLDVPANAKLFETIWESAHTVVQTQDFPYGVTSAQKALKSGALKSTLWGKNEYAIHVMHDCITEALGEGGLRAAA